MWDRGNESKLRRHYLLSHPLLMKPNDATGEPDPSVPVGWTPTAGTLLRTKATTIRKLYDDVVKRLRDTLIIKQECELLRIEQEVRIRDKPSVWVCLWDARDRLADSDIPPALIPKDDTNLYFVVGELHHDNTRYDYMS